MTKRLSIETPAASAASWPARRPPSLQAIDAAGDAAMAAACDGRLCSDCPPPGYPTDKTRCTPCPRRVPMAPRFATYHGGQGPKDWPARRPPSPAYAEACAAIEAKAGVTVRAVIKDLARAYALRPRQLDAIVQGLFDLSPGKLVEALQLSKLHNTRWTGFGGEITALNYRAARLYARYSRAKAHQIART